LPSAHGIFAVYWGAALSSHQRDLAVGRVPSCPIWRPSHGAL